MLPINYSRYKYTPDEMPQEEFLERFVVRTEIFEDIFEDIKSSDYKVANQHYIIIGQRGQGKTTLLRKLLIEVENDKKLSKFLIPVKFAEEQYQIRSLSRLWEEVADYLQSLHEGLFPHVLDDMEEHFDDEDYELKAFSYLESALKKKKIKLLLLIDNIDELIGKLNEKEQRRLREILLESSSFRIVGGSTKMLEQHYDYGKPFYEFFKIIKLKGFTKEESVEFLRSIGKGEQKEKMEAIIKNNPARIETLRQLTGGVPRTLVMLFDIFLDEEGNAFDDLLKVLDEATPLYKHRLDELPPQLQEIVHTIAINWDGMYTAEIAKKTRLSTKVISAQLGKLEKYDIVESEVAGKNKIYKIKERFFNIWYLMRFARKKNKQRVEWLIRFLNSWHSPDELEDRAKYLIQKIKEGDLSESYVFYMSQALSNTKITLNIIKKLKNTANEYLDKVKSNFSINKVMMKELDRKTIKSLDSMMADIIINTSYRSTLNGISEIYKQRHVEILKNYSEMKIKNDAKNFTEEIVNFRFKRVIEEVIENKFFESELKFNNIFSQYKMMNIAIPMIDEYFILLLSKNQFYQVKNILENKDFNLKEKYKPIWYALMTLMQDFPHEIKKMGSELQESVDEVLRKVDEYKVKYVE